MREMRGCGAECAIKLDMFRCIREVVLASDDMRDFHFDVVDYIDEMKNPRAVGPADRHIGMGAWICKIEIDFATDDVIDHHVLTRRAKTECARVFENMAGVLKLFQILLVNIRSFALQIWSEISAHMRTFIPIEAEPAQSFINRGGGFFSIARSIGVLDAQNEFAVVMSREEPIEKGRTRAADVEIAGGRGDEADTDFGIHCTTSLSTDQRR